jgi:hypothetical protein
MGRGLNYFFRSLTHSKRKTSATLGPLKHFNVVSAIAHYKHLALVDSKT